MDENIFNSFPYLETDRLILREMREADLGLIFEFNADPDNLKYVAREYYTEEAEALAKRDSLQAGFTDKTGIIWAFDSKKSGESLGYGGFFDIHENRAEAEIGYGILKNFWGQGFVSEVVKEITRFGFQQMDLQRIFGRVDPGNLSSARILEKSGYLNEGVSHRDEYARGQYFDMTTWAITRDQNL